MRFIRCYMLNKSSGSTAWPWNDLHSVHMVTIVRYLLHLCDMWPHSSMQSHALTHHHVVLFVSHAGNMQWMTSTTILIVMRYIHCACSRHSTHVMFMWTLDVTQENTWCEPGRMFLQLHSRPLSGIPFSFKLLLLHCKLLHMCTNYKVRTSVSYEKMWLSSIIIIM